MCHHQDVVTVTLQIEDDWLQSNTQIVVRLCARVAVAERLFDRPLIFFRVRLFDLFDGHAILSKSSASVTRV